MLDIAEYGVPKAIGGLGADAIVTIMGGYPDVLDAWSFIGVATKVEAGGGAKVTDCERRAFVTGAGLVVVLCAGVLVLVAALVVTPPTGADASPGGDVVDEEAGEVLDEVVVVERL
jgi:hypothetical protein